MFKILFATTVLTLSIPSWASKVDASFETRIANACIRSVEIVGKKISNHRAVCKCIGETHYRSAAAEPKQKDATNHIEWIVKFYETTDMKVLQKMVNKNPALSAFDDQVVDDCMMSANQGDKK